MSRRRDSITGTGAQGVVQGDGQSALVGVLDGFGTATVVFQISVNDGTNWEDYSSHTADVAFNIPAFPAGVQGRFNCTAYTSGTIVASLACGKR